MRYGKTNPQFLCHSSTHFMCMLCVYVTIPICGFEKKTTTCHRDNSMNYYFILEGWEYNVNTKVKRKKPTEGHIKLISYYISPVYPYETQSFRC